MQSVPHHELYDTQGRRLYLSADERRAFIGSAATAARPVRTLCTVLHDTGCRISEALALTSESIDLSGRAVMFESLKKRRHGICRAVPVPPTLSDTLDMVHGIREAQKRGGGQSDRPLWSWARNTAWRHVKAVMADAGIPDGPHRLPKGLRTATRSHHQLGRAAQHALEVDGPCHP
jgi:integrase/recombinase XerD